MISEWNWGADQTMNGALEIAVVLGIYGRENFYSAAYWTYPPVDSPGFYAFKMYTNYNDQGGRFGGQDGGSSIQTSSEDTDRVTSYVATDTSGKRLYMMLINKDPEAVVNAKIDRNGFPYTSQAEIYLYGNDDLVGIGQNAIVVEPEDLHLTLPAYSITLLILNRSG